MGVQRLMEHDSIVFLFFTPSLIILARVQFFLTIRAMDDPCLDNIGQNSTYLLESRREEQILLSSQKSIPGLSILIWLALVVLQTTEGWNTLKYSLNRWLSLKVHHWETILRFLTTIRLFRRCKWHYMFCVLCCVLWLKWLQYLI